MSCFKVQIYQRAGVDYFEVTYKGVRVFKESADDGFEYFLEEIRSHNGMDKFTSRADKFFLRLDDDAMEFLEDLEHGISFYRKPGNADLFDHENDIIFRGKEYMLRNFIDIRKTYGTPIWDGHVKSFWASFDAVRSDAFEKAAAKLASWNPPIIVKVSLNGMSPDFRRTPDYLFKRADDVRLGDIRIKMTGSRKLDFEEAFRLAEIDPDDALGYTWHHLDDFDPNEGWCTMQLVQNDVHKAISHTGAVRMWELFYGAAVKGISYAS